MIIARVGTSVPTLLATLLFLSWSTFAGEFHDRREIQYILDRLMEEARSNVIEGAMVNFVYYDAGLCTSCPPEEVERGKTQFRRILGSRFQELYDHHYKAHLEEAQYQMGTLAHALPNSVFFAREGTHVLDRHVFTGCDDFTKGFVELALRQGISPPFLRYVFLMADDGYQNACGGNMGLPAHPHWGSGGHEIPAVRISGQWYFLNSTSPRLDLVPVDLERIHRGDLIQFQFTQGMPFRLLFAGAFPIEHYRGAFPWEDVFNIYVSGKPDSGVCTP